MLLQLTILESVLWIIQQIGAHFIGSLKKGWRREVLTFIVYIGEQMRKNTPINRQNISDKRILNNNGYISLRKRLSTNECTKTTESSLSLRNILLLYFKRAILMKISYCI